MHVPQEKVYREKYDVLLDQGPVVQSLVSLMTLLVVKMLTVLLSTI